MVVFLEVPPFFNNKHPHKRTLPLRVRYSSVRLRLGARWPARPRLPDFV